MKPATKRQLQLAVSEEGKFRNAVRTAVVAGLAVSPGALFAQTTTTTPAQPADKSATELETIEVTGSRLPQLNVTSSAPVTLIDDEELKFQGTVNVESLINSMPQSFAEFSTGDSNGATGTATVNLRGLGSARTLVLIDGKRLMPGDPLLSPSAPNLNFIPAPLIDSIQILSGGASAVYGSDAIAGVVNFIMKRDFEGFRLDASYRETSKRDSLARDYYAVWGNNFGGGNGNVTLYAGYTTLDGLTQDKRDFSACSFTTKNPTASNPLANTRHDCSGSRTIPEGLVLSYDDYFNGNPYYHIVDPAGTKTFIADDSRTFNFAPYNFFQRPTERYSLGGFAHREINENLDFYGSAMFMDDRTEAQIAPSGLFFVNAQVPCDNPLMSAQQKTILCTNNGLSTAVGTTDVATILFAKRTVELGNRVADIRHTDFRIQGGVKGAVPFLDGVNYDVSFQRGQDIYAAGQLNYVNTDHARNGLQAKDDGSGNAVCASGDPSCVPIDLWQIGALTTPMKDYLRATGYQQANMIETVGTGFLSADLGRYGVRIPTANSGVAVAAGVEYRGESLEYRPDDLVAQGQLGGGGGPSPAISGTYGVNEFFGELRLPIVENQPFVNLLQLNGAYRNSDYNSSAGKVDSYMGGLEYGPSQDVTIRANYQRATRAPQITELYSPQSLNLFSGSDPCAGKNLGKPTSPTQAQCANSGVTATQYTNGSIQDCVSGQCNGLFGGNANLDVEESTTKSFGLVLTPKELGDLTVTVDYFNIELTNAIGSVPPTVLLTQCIFTGDPASCAAVHRGPTGLIWGEPTNPNAGYVDAFNVNLSSFKTTGIDLEGDYKVALADWGMADAGRLRFNYVTTYLHTLKTNVLPSVGAFDCAGLYGITCGSPSPHYRHKFRTTWYAPMGVAVSAQWRYFGSAKLDKNTNDPNLVSGTPDLIDAKLKAKNYIDLSASYTLPWNFTVTRALTVRGGVNNLFNEKPQAVSSNNPNPVSSPPFGNGNTFPNVYDIYGPSFFVGLQADF